MNVLKNMEAIFVVALGLACAAAFAGDKLAASRITAPAMVAAASDISVVVVSAKHMTAEEKMASLRSEHQLSAARAHAQSNT